ncbi:hypothetical protein Pla52o_51780 [Novipirellula galeiformis]|uniref:Uncharacterized protein n=1 Tax=Novipirellula galeiformis TaxID=2528004 RepID=A0A5C6C2C4_9BACT|nr:hypothetical protein [Novipirellula galeiformis]TWU17374.1 hypothetical protein Pla52o_51780 [Novipirellula galeiformis]
MRFYINWLERGFRVVHTPGIARAYMRIENDGDFFVLTDLGGCDLPQRNGPFQITQFSKDDQVVDGPMVLDSRLGLAAWLRSRCTIPIPTDPRM